MVDFIVNLTMILWAVSFFCPVPHWFAIFSAFFPFVMFVLLSANNYFHGRY